ncbi:MAG: lipid A export permease/ATP-binding protein MsbA [Gammaproteobacteria bacterium]|nr:lipid A export permease/ATP-binding protein MsbA [Gammaproteobacteria bacterium]
MNSWSVYLRLLSYVKPYWFYFLLSILGFMLYSGTQPALAWVTGWLTESIYNPDELAKYLIPLTLIAIYFVRGIGSFIGTYFLAKVSENVVHTLRCEIFERQMELPKSFYDNNNSGHQISLIIYNVTRVTGAATDAIKVIIREGIAVLALFSYLFYLNWRLSLIFIVIIPLLGLVVSYASKKFKQLSKNIQDAMGNITHVTSEAIHGYQEVKSYAGEEYEKRRFIKASYDNFKHNIKLIRVAAINTPVLQMIVAFALAALLSIGLSFLDQMSAADFVTYMTAAGLLPKPIRQLSEVNRTIQTGIAASESIFELLDTDAEKNTGHIKDGRVEGRLEIKHLSFAYANLQVPENNIEKLVLQDINLTIESGQTIALVGRSGSGKSTLSQLVPRFYNGFNGDILLDDHKLGEYELNFLRSQIALVSQNVTLFNDTIANNIAYGALVSSSREQIIEAARSAYAYEFIQSLPQGFDTIVGENGALLSGGQKQRIAIARAILKDAPILIMDEATSALDTESERAIQLALETVVKGRTTLIIAHRLSTIENADKIVVLDQGRVVEQGTHTGLLEENGLYSQLYENQFK